MNWFKETNWAPKRTERPVNANAGSPAGGDAYGDGTPIVVYKWEIHSQDEGATLEGG